MKAPLATLFTLLAFAGICPGEEAPTLDSLIDRRIKLNEFYRDKYTKEAANSIFAKDLQPIERQLGQGWVDFLKFVKASPDRKLKIHVLELELLEEIRGSINDIEYSEDPAEKEALGKELKMWKAEYEAFKKIAAASK